MSFAPTSMPQRQYRGFPERSTRKGRPVPVPVPVPVASDVAPGQSESTFSWLPEFANPPSDTAPLPVQQKTPVPQRSAVARSRGRTPSSAFTLSLHTLDSFLPAPPPWSCPVSSLPHNATAVPQRSVLARSRGRTPSHAFTLARWRVTLDSSQPVPPPCSCPVCCLPRNASLGEENKDGRLNNLQVISHGKGSYTIIDKTRPWLRQRVEDCTNPVPLQRRLSQLASSSKLSN